jgi:hypothetical protein
VYLEVDSSSDQEGLWMARVPAGHEHVSHVIDGGVLLPMGLFDRCYATQVILAVPAARCTGIHVCHKCLAHELACL